MILVDFGGKIKGDSAITGHENWITVDSCQLGVGRAISLSGSGRDRDTSTPSFSEATFSKSTDISSTELFAQSIFGKKLCDKGVVRWVQTGGTDAGQVYMELELHEPIISSYSMSSGGERPSESIAINFTKIVMKYTQFKSGGETVQSDPKGWDLATGKQFNG